MIPWKTRFPLLLTSVLLMGPGVLLAQEAPPTEPPPPLQSRAIQFPPFEEFTLDNGLRVVVLEYGVQPVVSIRLYAPGGSAADPAGQAGLASMAAQVLTQGTAHRSAEEISEAIEGVGGSLSASAGRDFFSVSAVVLTEHAGVAMDLLGDVVRNATFPAEEVELTRRQTLSALQAQRGQPQAVASRRFSAVVYGEEHPYGGSPTPTSVQGVSRDDLIEYRNRVLAPEGSLVVIAGQLSRSQAESLVREHLGAWEGTAAQDLTLPPAPEREERRIYLVHRPGAAQSAVLVGHLGIRSGDPDTFPLLVMDRLLGGGADARLFRILREERGWTYGAYSNLSRPRARGTFLAAAEVRPEVTDSTVVELIHQLERLRIEPVPQEEMDAARNYLAGSFPLGLQTPDQVGGQVATNLLMGLPREELVDYPELIRAVTAEEVRRVAREHLHPDRAAIVVVGDASEILEPLEALGLAPIRLMDIDGETLDREEFLAEAAPMQWDPSRLTPGIRRYELFVQGNPLGNAEYRLERDGEDWVSTAVISSMAGQQETRLRFDARDFTPRSLHQDQAGGPMAISVELEVVEGRALGRAELPEQLGGVRDFDQELPPGTLLPGMDEYALAIADLEEGTRLNIPYLDVTQGSVITLEARVVGEEEISLAAGTFQTWVVEVSGAQGAMTLYLDQDSPHILIRQEFGGQPLRLDLSGQAPLP